MLPLGVPEQSLKRQASLLLTVSRLPWTPSQPPLPWEPFVLCVECAPPPPRLPCVHVGKRLISPEEHSLPPPSAAFPWQSSVPGSLLASIRGGNVVGQRGELCCVL